jgi:hypothetical protein
LLVNMLYSWRGFSSRTFGAALPRVRRRDGLAVQRNKRQSFAATPFAKIVI